VLWYTLLYAAPPGVLAGGDLHPVSTSSHPSHVAVVGNSQSAVSAGGVGIGSGSDLVRPLPELGLEGNVG